MKTSDFDYLLPPESIAQKPARQRDGSRLLHLPRVQGAFTDHRFVELPELLAQAGVSLLVINDTKVIPARLFGTKPTGGRVEFLLLEPEAGTGRWTALAKSGKPLHEGQSIAIGPDLNLTVTKVLAGGYVVVDFGEATLGQRAMAAFGLAPLPPYIRRKQGGDDRQRRQDRERYQTIYAAHQGAVAAPTAGLHFTDDLFAQLDAAGIGRATLTLHVGPGTFVPVRTENPEEHPMHSERFVITEQTADKINQARQAGQSIVAVGTTSCRALEAAADESGKVHPTDGSTELFIRPGYRFRVIDGLITNFHLPKSTLLMLVSALAGRERILAAYNHAVKQGYRFYSYGDAMLIL